MSSKQLEKKYCCGSCENDLIKSDLANKTVWIRRKYRFTELIPEAVMLQKQYGRRKHGRCC